MKIWTLPALWLPLTSGFITSVTSPIHCEYYNVTCVRELSAQGRNDIATKCYGTQTCPDRSAHTCYAVWNNKSALEDQEYSEGIKDHIHKSGLSVKMLGCFESTVGCNEEPICTESSVDPSSRGNHHFCCCKGDLCNSKFKWDPQVPLEPILEDKELAKLTNPEDESSSALHSVMYAILPLIAVIVAICAAVYVIRQRKVARFEAMVGSNGEEIGALVRDELGSPSHLAMQQRNIELLEIKARGRFGAVWKGRYGREMVAVKIFPLQDKNSWYAEQEIYNLPQMDHDNILKFVGVEKRGENLQMEFWLITSFHEKGSLCDFLKSNIVSWDDMCKIAYTMARGLNHLHEQVAANGRLEMKPSIAHRDFKSKNVLIKSDMSACIADFGLALVFEPGKAVGDAHGQVGTRRYMAPEVLEGAINFSRNAFLRIDMYACGLVLWELASRCSFGQPPMNGTNNNQVLSSVDEYKLPFEAEVSSPALDQMQDLVVNKRCRPRIKDVWRLHPGMAAFCNTIEECWDHDAEARLSASCVAERIKNLQHLDYPNRSQISALDEQQMNTLNQADSAGENVSIEMGTESTELTPLYIQVPAPVIINGTVNM